MSDWTILAEQTHSLFLAGQYRETRLTAEQALDAAERNAGPNSEAVATCLNNLGRLARTEARYIEAEQYYTRAMPMFEQALGPASRPLGRCVSNLAVVYSLAAKFRQAEATLFRALIIYRRCARLEQDCPPQARSQPIEALIAATMHALADHYERQDQLARAVPLYNAALETRERLFGPLDRTVARTLDDLWSLHENEYRKSEARTLKLRAIAIYEHILSVGPSAESAPDDPKMLAQIAAVSGRMSATGDQPPPVLMAESSAGDGIGDPATDLTALGRLYQCSGYRAASLACFRLAMELCTTRFGPTHLQTAKAMATFAGELDSFEDADSVEPVELALRSLALYRDCVGVRHPWVANSLMLLERCLPYSVAPEDRTPILRKAFELFEATLGPDHPQVAWALAKLAAGQSDCSTASTMFRRAVDIIERAYGEMHPQVSFILSLPKFCFSAKNCPEIVHWIEERQFEINEAWFGPDSPRVVHHLQNKASRAQNSGDLAQAETLLQRAIAIRSATERSPLDPLELLQTRLASVHIDQCRYTEAEASLNQLIAQAEQIGGPNSSSLKYPLSLMAGLYDKTGRPVEAKLLRQRRNEIDQLELQRFVEAHPERPTSL